MNSSVLRVGESFINANQLKYDDLICLYKEYIHNNGKFPTTTECVSKNNLPQMRIVNKILRDNQTTYKDFMRLLGNYSHVRTEGSDFETYLHRYKEISEVLGRAPVKKELTQNQWGLPSADWLVKNCPDPSVNSYNEFVVWTGYHSNKIKKWTKDEVATSLKSYERRVHRGLKKSDITPENVGFSLIVINRLFGTFGNAIVECGLLKHTPDRKPLSHYKSVLNDIISDYLNKEGHTYISWADIESGAYGNATYNHKTFRKVFEDYGENLNAFIKTCGCMLNSRGVGYRYTFDDGEMVRSNLEYIYSKFLRKRQLVYNRDYFRDVKYKSFSCEKSRIDCDYIIIDGSNKVYVEVAGMMYKPKRANWRTYNYPSKRVNVYRDTILKKEKIFKDIGARYLLLFSDDFEDEKYKDKTFDILGVSTCDKGE